MLLFKIKNTPYLIQNCNKITIIVNPCHANIYPLLFVCDLLLFVCDLLLFVCDLRGFSSRVNTFFSHVATFTHFTRFNQY